VLKRNTLAYREQITYLNIKGEHHIPEPLATLRVAYNGLRPGGKCSVWLYGREGNELYLAIAAPLPHDAPSRLGAARNKPHPQFSG
jgi:hypothetical protein